MGFTQFLFNVAGRNVFFNNNGDEPDWYEKTKIIFGEKGATFETRTDWVNVMAIRSFTTASRTNANGVFDDFIFVAWTTVYKGESRIRWQSFQANTDPSFQYMEGRNDGIAKKDQIRPGKTNEGYDADGDGKADLGMLPPGAYQYYTVPSVPKNAVLGTVFKPVPNPNSPLGIRVFRDSNRDGNFTQDDEAMIKNQDSMYEGYAMYIHRTSRTKQPDNTWSAGCQTMRLEDFEQFKEILAIAAKSGQKTLYLSVG